MSSCSSEFMFHQLTTISNHTSTVPEARYCILILLLMMLSSSPASPHNFLYQVPKGDLFTTFIPTSRSQNTTSDYCNFLLTLSSCFLVLHRSATPTVEVKSVGTFPVILAKLAPLPFHPKQSWTLSTMGGNESIFGQTLLGWGSGGNPLMSPKPIKKLSLGSESYVTITWKGFFTQSWVLLASIVWNWFRVIKWNFCHLSLLRDGKTFALELSKCSTIVFSKMIFEHSWWSVCRTKELWIRCQECSALALSQRQKELKVIIRVQHLFLLCVFLRHLMLTVLAFLLSENVHLEYSNGISLRQARIWPFWNLFSSLNIVLALTFYGK